MIIITYMNMMKMHIIAFKHVDQFTIIILHNLISLISWLKYVIQLELHVHHLNIKMKNSNILNYWLNKTVKYVLNIVEIIGNLHQK